MKRNNTEQQMEQMMAHLMHYHRQSEAAATRCAGIHCIHCRKYPAQKISEAIVRQKALKLILPAFPAKSANRQKTLSEKPDLGEIMSLTHLNELCLQLHGYHEPGIELIICSDGRVFNDLVAVSEADVDTYQQGIQDIIKRERLQYLSTFSLDDVYPGKDYIDMREQLIREFAESREQLLQRMRYNHELRYQYNGIHRFIFEDQLFLKPQLSKNQIRQSSKQTAYDVIRRSNAWSRLLASCFPEALRLSIHPQPCGSDKFGIQFLPSANRWATPWHNVLLKNAQGWQLVKRKEAEQLGATLNHDHYILEACQ